MGPEGLPPGTAAPPSDGDDGRLERDLEAIVDEPPTNSTMEESTARLQGTGNWREVRPTPVTPRNLRASLATEDSDSQEWVSLRHAARVLYERARAQR
eukprot:15437526-Alexandrium_andersonii.AAC.1